jgi:bacterial/archaeal transporter family protein
MRPKEFWWLMFCLACWGPYALLSKLGSNEISAVGMQFLFTLGSIPVVLVLLADRGFKLEKSRKGILYGLTAGLFSAAGAIGFFAAFRSGGNASVITTSTGMYPVVTVLLALVFLRERITWVQVVGLGFATMAFFIFSH